MSERRLGMLLVAPAVLLMTAVAGYPILAAVWLGFRRKIVVFHEDRFIGLANYRFLLRDGRFFAALGHTLYFAFVAVSVELLLGLAFALLLDASVRGRGLLRASILVPWAIPTVVSAKTWAWLFHPEYGAITRILPGRDVDFLGMPGWAMHAAIVVDVWKTTPFVALLLLAGLQTIPRDLHRAAALDGATRWQTFRSITLPLLMPTIAVTVVFRALDALRVFDAVYVLTDGGPANTTETLSIYSYKTLMRLGDFGYGSTLAVMTFVVIVIFSAVSLRAMRRMGLR